MRYIAGKDPIGALIRIGEHRYPCFAAGLAWSRLRHNLAPRVTEHMVQPGMAVADIGASVGAYTHRMAQLVGPSGQVHAFEPNPTSVEAVRAIARRYPAITTYNIALSDSDTAATLHVPHVAGGRRPGNGLGSLSLQPHDVTVTSYSTHHVQVATLDSVLLDREPLGFIKCDVEGHEYHVLVGARETLCRSQPHLLLEVEQRHQQEDIDRTFRYLLDLGYVGYAVTNAALMPLEQFDVERDQMRFLASSSAGWQAPGYINDFLFVASETAVTNLPVQPGS
jgi:FkbM family methyltransferase